MFIFRQTFQFKINSQILPTNTYLLRYRILDNDQCAICREQDTIIHKIWSCRRTLDFITVIFEFLNLECKTDLTINDPRNAYLFGFEPHSNEALNQILLELKIFNFYTLPKDARLNNDILKSIFFIRIRKIILQEKFISICKNKYDNFDLKWDHFTAIYDWRGPDYEHI